MEKNGRYCGWTDNRSGDMTRSYKQSKNEQNSKQQSQIKPAIERVQALANISHLVLYTFAVYKAVGLHNCILLYQLNPCSN